MKRWQHLACQVALPSTPSALAATTDAQEPSTSILSFSPPPPKQQLAKLQMAKLQVANLQVEMVALELRLV
jgi:hypothetical protein